jgi:hypothetical protein
MLLILIKGTDSDELCSTYLLGRDVLTGFGVLTVGLAVGRLLIIIRT